MYLYSVPRYPLLNDVSLQRGRDFKKSQKLFVFNGIRMEKNEGYNESVTCQSEPTHDCLFGKKFTENKLCFDAYYKDSTTGEYKTCKVLYYLEDGSIKIYDPKLKKINQDKGCLITRQKLKKTITNVWKNDTFYTIQDFNIGTCLEIYGNKYTLINCDSFTNEFLTNTGFKLKTPIAEFSHLLPESEIQKDFRRRTATQKAYKLAHFLETYPKMLRFYGIWEDNKVPKDKKLYIILLVSLTDGTFKIIEDRELDSRSYDSRLVLKPSLIPKVHISSVAVFAKDINVVMCLNWRETNSYRFRVKPEEFLTELDLDLGMFFNMYGYQLFLYDCDAYTKEYYYTQHKKNLMPVPKPMIPEKKIL
ncbi:EF-hand domain-containing family member C2-like [Stegodyphus dumicola]|uniref:EF-hand domain-containing family member C2-like n=1 Tax=Stegodyphus dumicola TaxID=202533 RepID=UPI0015B1F9FA|nr:EF-hand domain-containing family member C2-like [Stegodyphus dumicola]